MESTTREQIILSVYCISAQHSAIQLGRIARQSSDLQLRLELTRRAADSLRHSELWADTVRALGGSPRADVRPFQCAYEDEVGLADSSIDVLAMMQVAERRLARQMLRHFHSTDVHPIVRASLQRMIEEELNPGWPAPCLAGMAEVDAEPVRRAQRRYAAADRTLSDPFAAVAQWQDAA